MRIVVNSFANSGKTEGVQKQPARPTIVEVIDAQIDKKNDEDCTSKSSFAA
jgi:hypothetical protein